METGLLDQGITLMLVGMGTVFVFLTLLVLAMSTMSAIAMRFNSAIPNDDIGEEEIAAISAAIMQHRRRQ